MKYKKAKPANQGVRSDRFSGCKESNLRRYDPSISAIVKAYWDYYSEMYEAEEFPLFFTSKVHDQFIMPVTEEDLREELARVPASFSEGLKGVFLLSGSKKVLRSSFDLFCYGTYWNDCVFLHPYPRKFLTYHYPKPPKPSLLHEFRRVGAVVSQADRTGVQIDLSGERLRNFYLRDVFIHELGHHVDKLNTGNYDKKEGFAEWFATEYGFRRR